MRISIVVPDSMVVVDGVARRVNMEGLDPFVRAVQWDGEAGEIEYGPPVSRNEPIEGFSDFQVVLDRWIAGAPPIPISPTPEEVASRTAKARLAVLDADSIRYMREQLDALPTASPQLKALEAQAVLERAKLVR